MDCGGATSGIPSQFLQGAAAIHHQQQQINQELQNLINAGAPPEEIAAVAQAAEQLEAEAAMFHHQQHQQEQEQHQQQQWAAEFEQNQFEQQQQHHHQAAQAEAEAMEQQQMIMEMQQQEAMEQQQQRQQVNNQNSVPWDAEFANQQQAAAANGDWAQDFNNTDQVQVFGVQGDEGNIVSYEEKQQLSEFNGLMQDLKTGKAEIVEGDNGEQEMMRNGNDNNDEVDETTMEAAYNNTAEEQEFLNDFLKRQQERAAAGDFADDDEEFARQFMEQQRLQNDGEQWNLNDEDDEWASEFMENANKADMAKRSSEYPFEENNPYLFHENPFEEGVNFLQAGVLSEAVLAFEAACQQTPEKLEAWQHLGTTQAENEKDAHAITALNKALAIMPANPTVLLALAACFTNEMMHDKAMHTLKAWLKCDPKFVDLEEHLNAIQPSPEEQAQMNEEDEGQYVKDFFFVDSNEHRNICHLFEAASEIDPANVQIHVALGTLRHLGHEYLKAATHFEQAVKIQPDNEKLWNKLGATLANGQQSERAIDAYQRALDINPGFVRAEYNMGIANSNLGRHREAARHFVKAIMLQSGWTDPSCDEEGGAMSKSSVRTTRDIWDVLRMSLGCLERQDLVQASWQHKLTPFVREFGCMPAGVE